MTPDSAPELLPAPTVAEWRSRLAEVGTLELMPFTRTELACVGAGSPVRGLLADDGFLSLDGEDLQAAMARARRGLTERGLVGEPRPSPSDPSRLEMPLGGDLAGIVAVRRSPALIATVGAGPEDLVRRPGGDPAAARLIAVLHGVGVVDAGDAGGAGEGGLLGLLEETTTSRGLHLFALSTPAAEADRILETWQLLAEDGPAALSVHVFVPDASSPRHTQLALQAGVARMSSDGLTWQRSFPDYAWSDLFVSAVSSTFTR